MKTSFIDAVEESLRDNASNDYTDNWESRRFGQEPKRPLSQSVKDAIKRALEASNLRENKYLSKIKGRKSELEWIYQTFSDEESRALLIKLMAYRALGHKKVKLPLNTSQYWSTLDELETLANASDTLDIGFLDWSLNRYNLESLGYPINLYARPLAIYTQLIIQQYRCKLPDGTAIEVEPGETVIDAGGCYGDTALYFAHKTGNQGKVFSFEFMPDNIKIFQKNLALNPALAESIEIVQNPIWSSSGERLYVVGNGPAAYITPKEQSKDSKQVQTLSIDDLVAQKACNRVDFIKMDIEGAEAEALLGAVNTIRKHKPKLAISAYHKPDDIWSIPQWINQLELGYKFYLRHFTIHNEETVIFAIPH